MKYTKLGFIEALKEQARVTNVAGLQQVNCRGSYGAGLSGEISKEYPTVKEQYLKYCEQHDNKVPLGSLQSIIIKDNLTILNSYSQDGYGNPSKTHLVYTNEEALIKNIKAAAAKYEQLVIPYHIGCGLGGAYWGDILDKIKDIENLIIAAPATVAPNGWKEPSLPKQFNLIIAGSRTLTDIYPVLEKTMDYLLSEKDKENVIIRIGDAKGVDAAALEYAKKKGYKCIKYVAEWDVYGKKAGFLRDERMHFDTAALPKANRACVLFWDGSSKGTENHLNICQKYGTQVRVYDSEGNKKEETKC